jgi:hypothetical protein
LPTAFAPGLSAQVFFKKNRKTVFVDGLFQERSPQVFFQKKRKIVFADGPMPGAFGTEFYKKI